MSNPSNPYDKHPGKGFVEVRGYNPPGGTMAAEQKRQREEAERKERQQHHDAMIDASRNLSKEPPRPQGQESRSSCWIATAYFGDENHPSVVTLREYRDRLQRAAFFGGWVKAINSAYHFIGRSSFGHWWTRSLESPGSWQTVISGLVLLPLIILARSSRSKQEMVPVPDDAEVKAAGASPPPTRRAALSSGLPEAPSPIALNAPSPDCL